MLRFLLMMTFLTMLATHSSVAQPSGADGRMQVDLELVLAVDVSSSMDEAELKIQREGYAIALSNPTIVRALSSGRFGKVALLYVEWGKLGAVRIVIDWTVIQSSEDARQISQRLRLEPVVRLPGTSISGIMSMAANWIDENEYVGTRRVIDISGDGPNNDGPPTLEVREDLSVRGIEVNGLPLMFKEPVGYFNIEDLDRYYEDCVITGAAPFAIPVHDLSSFADALLLKLVLEISGRSPNPELLWQASNGTDCLIGEKLRYRFENLTGDSR